MWAEFSEIAKVAALFLAIFIPSIAIYFQYRREEAKQKAARVSPIVAGIGGALIERGVAEQQIEAVRHLMEAIKGLTRAWDGHAQKVDTLADKNEELIRLEMKRGEKFDRIVEETVKMRELLDRAIHKLERRS